MHSTVSDIDEFIYELPDSRIAKYPLPDRDSSKLLIYRNRQISHTNFRNLTALLEPGLLMVFNNTRVIKARLLFKKLTGARIEIFCLEPFDPADYYLSLHNPASVIWKCMVGNAKKWKAGVLNREIDQNGLKVRLIAENFEYSGEYRLIRFSWKPEKLSFADILESFGLVPIPPYLNREPESLDRQSYQTVYSRNEGSVAAPTAGFHFTERVLDEITKKNISIMELTLHVGAGTFRPVLANTIQQHTMHSEHIYFNVSHIKQLLKHQGKILAVGTTSVRTLETIYWLGCKVHKNHSLPLKTCQLQQGDDQNFLPLSKEQSLEALLEYARINEVKEFHTTTQLMIIPGYRFRMVNQLITNFHQPKSTLLLLVSAFVGSDWKRIYDYAMQNDFRFLSYGDSSLLIP